MMTAMMVRGIKSGLDAISTRMRTKERNVPEGLVLAALEGLDSEVGGVGMNANAEGGKHSFSRSRSRSRSKPFEPEPKPKPEFFSATDGEI